MARFPSRGGPRPPFGYPRPIPRPSIPGHFLDPLKADAIVLIGASLMDYGDDSTEQAAYIQAAFRNLGYRGVLDNRAVRGDRMAQTQTRLDDVAVDYASTARRAFAMMHRPGNDITAMRPLDDTQGDFIRTGLSGITDRLKRIGFGGFAAASVTKRFYTADPAVLYNDPATDVNGSLPYNEAYVIPWIEKEMPRYASDGVAKIDAYEWVNESRWIVTYGDKTHLVASVEHIFPEWLLYQLKRQHDNDVRADVAGKSFVFRCAAGDDTAAAAVDAVTYGGAVNVIPKFRSYITDQTGAVCPHFAVDIIGGSIPSNQGGGDAAIISDARLQGAAMNTHYTYASAAESITRQAFVQTRHMGLPTGATGRLTLAASRAATGTDRRGDVVVNGATVGVLDAATNATSNELANIPFEISDDGVLDVRITPSAGSNYAYQTSWALDFD
ncbi:hypothetical protein [Thioclava sp. GXIMD4216]|uniref:hypothetical protein n=1 Tax=Thioclava sp. GXIMD4216 TaxID=3131929 RepID=UPI0030CE649C